MFSPRHKSNFKFSVTFILSSANAFDLDKPKILSFDKELKEKKKKKHGFYGKLIFLSLCW